MAAVNTVPVLVLMAVCSALATSGKLVSEDKSKPVMLSVVLPNVRLKVPAEMV